MGVRGPVPKRSDERVRRNKPDVAVEKVVAIGAVMAPDQLIGIGNPHPLTQYWFESFKSSAQSRFYEPTDWAKMMSALHLYDSELKSGRPIRATMIAEINGMWSDLMACEPDRRRVGLELERGGSLGGDVLNVAEMFRQKFAEG